MNLIQIQEHLKDMPMRAIMEYANGKSTQVPPYLALGELNRRKQMSQQATQPPQGTVKDKIEQEVTGGQPNPMQAAAQGMPQAMPQTMPQAAPQGQPAAPEQAQPMPQMAGGGLTALPVGDMFKFASGGGVVAFAEGDVVVDEFSAANPESYAGQLELNKVRNEESQRKQSQKELLERIKFLETAAPEVAERLKRERASELPKAESAAVKVADKVADKTAQGVASLDKPAPVAPPPPPAGGGIPAAIGMPKSPTFEKPDANAYDTKLAAFKQANPGMAGSEFQKLLDKIAQQDEADRARFMTQEKGRTRADFWQALIDAGESTRGQKGLGALLGGFGRSAGASQAKADERADAQAKMRRDQELGMAKMRAELESARRAEARGDFEAAFKHRQDADKIARDLQQTEFSNKMEAAKLAEQARGNTIQAAAANRTPALIQLAQEIQRQNQNTGMTFNEALERASVAQQGAQYQNAEARKNAAIDKAYQEERPHDPKYISIMAKTPEERQKMLKENEDAYNRVRARFGVTPTGEQTDPNAPSPGFGQARPK